MKRERISYKSAARQRLKRLQRRDRRLFRAMLYNIFGARAAFDFENLIIYGEGNVPEEIESTYEHKDTLEDLRIAQLIEINNHWLTREEAMVS